MTIKADAELSGVSGLICYWDFSEPGGERRYSKGPHRYALREQNGPIARIETDIEGTYAAKLEEGQWFLLPRSECPALNLHGKDAQVTVIAWLKREQTAYSHCEAVAGMWDETRRKRQYCLFLNLAIWDSGDQVCGHVSSVGGPTPGYKYCMDASIGETEITFDRWYRVAFTYDGTWVKSFINGVLDERPGRNPYAYEGGLFDAGDDGADFTVGGVHRSDEMGNWFKGMLGGLAVFNRALSGEELARIERNVPML